MIYVVYGGASIQHTPHTHTHTNLPQQPQHQRGAALHQVLGPDIGHHAAQGARGVDRQIVVLDLRVMCCVYVYIIHSALT